jgi:hypothetical protein
VKNRVSIKHVPSVRREDPHVGVSWHHAPVVQQRLHSLDSGPRHIIRRRRLRRRRRVVFLFLRHHQHRIEVSVPPRQRGTHHGHAVRVGRNGSRCCCHKKRSCGFLVWAERDGRRQRCEVCAVCIHSHVPRQWHRTKSSPLQSSAHAQGNCEQTRPSRRPMMHDSLACTVACRHYSDASRDGSRQRHGNEDV